MCFSALLPLSSLENEWPFAHQCIKILYRNLYVPSLFCYTGKAWLSWRETHRRHCKIQFVQSSSASCSPLPSVCRSYERIFKASEGALLERVRTIHLSAVQWILKVWILTLFKPTPSLLMSDNAMLEIYIENRNTGGWLLDLCAVFYRPWPSSCLK